MFAQALGENNSRAIGSEDFDLQGYVEQLVNAAETRAYAELDWGEIGGFSPVFVSSLILISLSYTVSIFDQEMAWSAADRQTVIEWGNKIDSNQQAKKQYSTLDSIAAIAAARMSWGAATSQPGIFGRGLDDFHVVASNMDKNGQYESSLSDNNEDVQFMILAAEAATRNGIAAFNFSYGGKTLHDAVKWHVDKTLKQGGMYTRANGRANHIAWAPIYLSRFPDGPTAKSLKELLSSVDRTRQGLRGTTMGGSTECLWGRHR